MKQVAVISEYRVIAEGSNDGKIIDKYYTRVNGELYFAGSLIRLEDKELVTKLMDEQKAIKKAAEDRLWEIQTIFNNILVDGLETNNYPSIRSKDWFKAIKPTV